MGHVIKHWFFTKREPRERQALLEQLAPPGGATVADEIAPRADAATCKHCHGSGVCADCAGAGFPECGACEGAGYCRCCGASCEECDGAGRAPCMECDGSGDCAHCGGSGRADAPGRYPAVKTAGVPVRHWFVPVDN